MTETVTSADGTPIAYDVTGGGSQALVFVHGWSCDRRYWREQVPAFSSRFTTVAVDLAGHGESGAGRNDWSIEAFGADVAAVVRRLALTRVVLVGHSMGGDVVLETARQLSGDVLGAVWVDTYRTLPVERTSDTRDRLIASLRDDFASSTRALVRTMFTAPADAALVQTIADDMASASPSVAIPALDAAMAYALVVPRVLQELKLPLMALNPEQPPSNCDALSRHGVELVTLPGVGHFPMLEDPATFNRCLDSAIERLTVT
jgi:pimeloyl-ACP methyl ester carboxylesterase